MAGKGYGMMPPMDPSAPPDDDMSSDRPHPPSYNEAMGWSHPPGGQVPQPQPQGMIQPHPVQPQPMPARHNVPQPAYPVQPAGASPSTVLLIQQPAPAPTTVTQVVLLGPKSAKINCPSCHASISTTTETVNKMSAHIACCICFLFLCWPCCCLPYCMSAFKIVNHTCPNCKSFLGSYRG